MFNSQLTRLNSLNFQGPCIKPNIKTHIKVNIVLRTCLTYLPKRIEQLSMTLLRLLPRGSPGLLVQSVCARYQDDDSSIFVCPFGSPLPPAVATNFARIQHLTPPKKKMHTIDCRCFQWRPQSLAAAAGKAKAKAKAGAGAVRYFRGCSCCKLSGAFVLRFLLVLMIDTVPSSFVLRSTSLFLPPVTTGSLHGHGHNRVTVCCIGCLFVFVASPPLSLFSCMLSDFPPFPRLHPAAQLLQSLCNILFSIRI